MVESNGVTSCTHTALGHFLHPLCPAQSELKRVANIVVPLFVILGAIYYGWRYFYPVISLEKPPSNLEIRILKQIEERNFTLAEELIPSISELEKRTVLLDTLNETRTIEYIHAEQLTEAKKTVALIKDSSRKDSLLEKIFSEYLEESFLEFLKPAEKIIDDFSDQVNRDEFRERLIMAAIEMGEFRYAFKNVTNLASESVRKKYFIQLTPQIIKNVDLFVPILESLELEKSETIIEEICDMFFEAGHVKPALSIGGVFEDKNKEISFLTKIVRSYLEKKDFVSVYAMVSAPREIKNEKLHQIVFDEAIGQRNLELAAVAAIGMEEGSEKQECFVQLAPKIAENSSEFIQTELFQRPVFDWSNDLLIKIVELLMAHKKFTDAIAIARKLTFNLRGTWVRNIQEAQKGV